MRNACIPGTGQSEDAVNRSCSFTAMNRSYPAKLVGKSLAAAMPVSSRSGPEIGLQLARAVGLPLADSRH